MSPRLRYAAQIAALAAVYFLTAHYGLKLEPVSGFASLVWAPAGISLAALLIFGMRLWPSIAIGAFLANLSAGAPWAAAFGICAGNTLEALSAAYFLNKVGFQRSLERLHSVLALGFAAVAATAISATIGVLSLVLGGMVAHAALEPTWLAWWLGDGISYLVITPFLLVWSTRPKPFHDLRRTVEALAMAAIVMLSTVMIYTDGILDRDNLFPRPYFTFPILMAVAMRFGQRGLVLANLFVASVAIWGAATGHSRFTTGPVQETLVLIQVFLSVVIISKLILAAIVSERAEERKTLRKNEESQQFLIDATMILSQSLDYKTTLRHVAKLSVPRFADWCLVHTLGVSGGFESIDLACAVPEKEESLREFATHYLTDLNRPTAIASVLKTKKSRLIQVGTPAAYRAISGDEDHFELLSKIGFKSLIVCPLLFHDKTLGAISVGSIVPDRIYNENDVRLMEELSRRAAIAIENARLYREAQEALLSRDEFLSIASHELKTPLTSLSLQLQLFRRRIEKILASDKEPPNGAPSEITIPLSVAAGVTSCENQARKLTALLDELLDLTRIRLGKLQLTRESVNLGTLVNEVLDRFKTEAAQKSIPISVKVDPLIVGEWDRLRIEQVVSNLISNALKYGDRKPISVLAEFLEKHSAIRLTVQDWGQGISTEMQEVIFERFERAGMSGQKISGLGLGLYICRQIIEAHGGIIRVESKPGHGSTFFVDLPLTGSAPKLHPARSDLADAPHLR